MCCRSDRTGGEQRLATVELELGPRRIGLVEPVERPFQQARRQRQIVARQGAAAGSGEVPCGPLADRPPPSVDRTQLTQVLMGLLEMPADRLVLLADVAGVDIEPVREAGVQLGARALQEPAVRRVADQRVVKLEDALTGERSRLDLDQLAAPQRLEPRVEFRMLLGRQQMSECVARELPPDDGGPLEDAAFLRTQSLEPRCEQRLAGRRHLESGELDPDDPVVSLLLAQPVV